MFRQRVVSIEDDFQLPGEEMMVSFVGFSVEYSYGRFDRLRGYDPNGRFTKNSPKNEPYH